MGIMMENKLDYRYNIMKINSPEAFMNVRGGCTHWVRDVYFLRVLGVDASIAETVAGIDADAAKEVFAGRLGYLRLNKLMQLKDTEDIAYYSREYDKWKNEKKPIILKNMALNTELQAVLDSALNKLDEVYRSDRAAVSDSIVRNFLTKVLFWLDCISKDILCGWSVRRSTKIIAENIVKEQEYLFFYFLTRLGCDVMLLQTFSDVKITDRLKNLSGYLVLGDFGRIVIPEYKKQPENTPKTADIHRAAQNSQRTEYGQESGKGNTESCRQEQKTESRKEVVLDRSSLKRADDRNTSYKTNDTPKDKEKSFEELACLASSIVMISVHESDGGVKSSGSGIMIGKDGYILTNCHVIAGGSFYSVRIEDDNEIYTTDELIKYNSDLDMAIIRINRKLNPLHIYDGKQKLARGQKVVAIGSPLGLFNSVSDGIISGFRTIKDESMIQFTAPISPGSSGGAVLNMQGELIGISTAGIDNGQNINLAVDYENILLFTRGFR